MRRLAILLLALAPIALATPALAEQPATSPVVLRGSSALPTPWYEPPPEPKVIVQLVYVPLYYYLPVAHDPFIHRHPHTSSARRNR